MGGKSLRAEIEEMRAELASLRRTPPGQTAPEAGAGAEPEAEGQFAELNRLVQHMLEAAEDTVAEHPAATVAGALALGIVIGRLSAR